MSLAAHLAEALDAYSWKPIGSPMSGNLRYIAMGSLAGRAELFRKRGARGGKGSFILKLDGKEYDLGKKATFDHADAMVRRQLK